MKVVENTVEGVRLTIATMACSVLCCGMALRVSPTNKRDKERLRRSLLREEEQDRILRIIKGIRSNSCFYAWSAQLIVRLIGVGPFGLGDVTI
jgi:hypothetical protein